VWCGVMWKPAKARKAARAKRGSERQGGAERGRKRQISMGAAGREGASRTRGLLGLDAALLA
jgi:hypothetical protein